MRKSCLLLKLLLVLSLLAGCGAMRVSNNGAANVAGTVEGTRPAAQTAANNASSANASEPAEPADKQITPPDAVVADLYRQSKKKSPFFQTDDRALVDRYFEKGTADLIWKDAVESDGEIGALEADPLYDAQDTQIKNFNVAPPEIKGERAEVKVSFQNFGKKRNLVYTLALRNGVWKISDIKYEDGRTLVGMLKEGAAS